MDGRVYIRKERIDNERKKDVVVATGWSQKRS